MSLQPPGHCARWRHVRTQLRRRINLPILSQTGNAHDARSAGADWCVLAQASEANHETQPKGSETSSASQPSSHGPMTPLSLACTALLTGFLVLVNS